MLQIELEGLSQLQRTLVDRCVYMRANTHTVCVCVCVVCMSPGRHWHDGSCGSTMNWIISSSVG